VLKVADFSSQVTSVADQLKVLLPDTLDSQNLGLEIGFKSNLPAGSGMGGSSIIAAAILSSVGTLLGLNVSNEDLVYQVSQVEQVLTTGGGWQDQVGAIYGGFKIAQSPSSLPLRVSVTTTSLSDDFYAAFEKRTFVVYTGQQRLAKNTLINALRKCALMPAEDVTTGNSTVSKLIQGALRGFDILKSVELSQPPQDYDEVLDNLAAVLDEYWSLKKEMAAGSEPSYMKEILDSMRPLASGLSLCGAGAGGYAVVILKRSANRKELEECVEGINRSTAMMTEGRADRDHLSVHSVVVDRIGIETVSFTDCDQDLSFYLNA